MPNTTDNTPSVGLPYKTTHHTGKQEHPGKNSFGSRWATDMAYSEKVVEHYENPRNVGSFEKGDDTVGTGMVGAPA